MSLKKDIVNAEIMLTDLIRRAKDEGVSAYTYIIHRGKLVDESATSRNVSIRLSVDSMDFMTFYTCSNWSKSGTVVMVLGIYSRSELALAVGEQLLGKTLVTDLDRYGYFQSPMDKAAVYVSMNFGKIGSFFSTTMTDGWSGIKDGVKYQMLLKPSLINWLIDPFEVKS